MQRLSNERDRGLTNPYGRSESKFQKARTGTGEKMLDIRTERTRYSQHEHKRNPEREARPPTQNRAKTGGGGKNPERTMPLQSRPRSPGH